MAVDVERKDRVAVVTWNRPEVMNALDADATDELDGIFDDLARDRDVWVVVVTGAGDRAFCAGADLKAMVERNASGAPRREPGPNGFAGLVKRDFAKPVVAAVNGLAYGGGFEVVLACDLAVADERARFALPEVKRGIVAAAGGLVRLSTRIPLAVAEEMALTGDPITAQRAAELGLVNRVVPAGRSVDAALELAERVAANAPLAVRMSKTLLRRAVSTAEDELWRLQAALGRNLLASADASEGPRAFAEKRAPVWRGR
jgi:enoyl-CoA hydratase/carnithine racemase